MTTSSVTSDSSTRKIQLIFTQDMSKTVQTQGQWTALTKQELLKLTLKKASLFFGLAVFSIFIPVFHFVLVPVFLLITAVVIFKGMSPRFLLQLQGPHECTSCHQSLPTERVLDSDPRLECEHCHGRYLVKIEDPVKPSSSTAEALT